MAVCQLFPLLFSRACSTAVAAPPPQQQRARPHADAAAVPAMVYEAKRSMEAGAAPDVHVLLLP
jgi:hypothetical protein